MSTVGLQLSVVALPSDSSCSRALLKESAIGAYPHSDMLSCSNPLRLTSGKSTQKAFIFKPYRKLAKFSLNRAKLSCINCKCIKFASRSAIESDNSANAGSKVSKGVSDTLVLALADSRKDDREEGRKGVVGRDTGPRLPDVDRFMLLPA
jgi:hypothetical protein